MDNTINIKDLFSKQKELDLKIQKEHHVTYESTHNKRILALLVELGELANEVRVFKFWSNKEASPKEIILDEFADALHFFLSIGIDIGSNKYLYTMEFDKTLIVNQFLETYNSVVHLYKECLEENYEKAFQQFFTLGISLGFSQEDILEAYYKKLQINYIRQMTNY